MRNYSFPIAAALALLIACSSQAAEKPRPAQGNQNQPKKVWTNEDMDQLRARGLISIVGQEVTVADDAGARSASRNHLFQFMHPGSTIPSGMPKRRPIFRPNWTSAKPPCSNSKRRSPNRPTGLPSRALHWTRMAQA